MTCFSHKKLKTTWANTRTPRFLIGNQKQNTKGKPSSYSDLLLRRIPCNLISLSTCLVPHQRHTDAHPTTPPPPHTATLTHVCPPRIATHSKHPPHALPHSHACAPHGYTHTHKHTPHTCAPHCHTRAHTNALPHSHAHPTTATPTPHVCTRKHSPTRPQVSAMQQRGPCKPHALLERPHGKNAHQRKGTLHNFRMANVTESSQ